MRNLGRGATMRRQFWQWWETLKTFGGRPDGASDRVAFTAADAAARRWLADLWAGFGFRVQLDGIGNVVATIGTPPYCLLASHTDTVPGGGHFDGILGVLAATAVAKDWNPAWGGLCLIDWSGEESSRFAVSTVGSRSALGELDESYWEATDADGLSLKDAARQQYGLGRVPLFRLDPATVRAALEWHIEQGNELVQAHQPVGVVTAIAAPQRWFLRVIGQTNHSGATPMGARRDALAGLAQLILAVERLAREGEARGLRSTVTRVRAVPGATNVIAGEAEGLVDVRVQSHATLEWYRRQLAAAAGEVERQRLLRCRLEEVSGEAPGRLDPGLQQLMAERIAARGLTPYRLASWPSHDSLTLSRHVPTGMLFVRNPSGVSHNPAETVEDDDLDLALELLWETARAVAAGAQGPAGAAQALS